MAVTMGREVTRVAQEWYQAGKYQDYLYLHGLGVESAEALAEMFHKQLRAEWGIGGQDSPQIQKLFKGHYRGCRYSFGYPACPNLEDQAPLFTLIDPTRVGITLSDQFQLEPEQSTTAIVMHHPGREVLQCDAIHGLCGNRFDRQSRGQRVKESRSQGRIGCDQGVDGDLFSSSTAGICSQRRKPFTTKKAPGASGAFSLQSFVDPYSILDLGTQPDFRFAADRPE